MKTKVIIGISVGLCGVILLINGLINDKNVYDTSANEIKQQITSEIVDTNTNTTTTIKKSKKVVKTTKKKKSKKSTKKKVSKKVSGFNVKASKSEIQQYARSLLNKEDYEALNFIITHESGWNANNINKKSGASGLCQSLPASKMSVSGKDYKTNYKTQINWCILYCNTRYGSIQKAKQFWLKHHWF